MNCIGTYDGTIFYNPANKFCIISVKTADQSVPAEARSNRRYKDHLIRFTAVGYEIPRTDAVELELDGEWAKGKYGVQLQVEQWREIVPRTKNGVEGYLASGLTKLFYGPDFVFVSGDSQEDTAEKITERYCLEIQESGIENVQILSPFRSEGAASSEQLNETIRELVNPFRSAEEEIKFGPRIFRVNDRIMQTKNTEKVSNGDLGFIRYIKDTDQGKKIGMDFGAGRTLEYGVDDLSNVDLAYATTIHKAMGSEYETVIMPLLKAHTIMM